MTNANIWGKLPTYAASYVEEAVFSTLRQKSTTSEAVSVRAEGLVTMTPFHYVHHITAPATKLSMLWEEKHGNGTTE